MVRNVAEMMGAGCVRFYSGGGWGRNLEECAADNACLVCRIFGFTKHDYSWAGKVRFSDTGRVAVNWTAYEVSTTRPILDKSNGEGWIVFPHSAPPAATGRGSTWFARAPVAFPFRVEYLNLDPEEYAVFRFALTLSHAKFQLCHKLGYAKSLGFGACRITIANDPSPPIGPEIEAYLADAPFQYLEKLRSLP